MGVCSSIVAIADSTTARLETVKEKLAKWEHFVTLMGDADVAGQELLAAAPTELPGSAKQEALTRDIDNALAKDSWKPLATILGVRKPSEDDSEDVKDVLCIATATDGEEQASYQESQFCRCIASLLRQTTDQGIVQFMSEVDTARLLSQKLQVEVKRMAHLTQPSVNTPTDPDAEACPISSNSLKDIVEEIEKDAEGVLHKPLTLFPSGKELLRKAKITIGYLSEVEGEEAQMDTLFEQRPALPTSYLEDVEKEAWSSFMLGVKKMNQKVSTLSVFAQKMLCGKIDKLFAHGIAAADAIRATVDEVAIAKCLVAMTHLQSIMSIDNDNGSGEAPDLLKWDNLCTEILDSVPLAESLGLRVIYQDIFSCFGSRFKIFKSLAGRPAGC